MALTQLQIQNVCLLGQGSDQCRYLAQDDHDWAKYYCLKKSSNKKEIDQEVEDFLEDCKRKGRDPEDEGNPLGDNCLGYLPLSTKQQGYDVP